MRGDIERWVRQAREDQAGALRARLGSYDRMRWASLARGDRALAARYDALIQDAERSLAWGAASSVHHHDRLPGVTPGSSPVGIDGSYGRV